MGTAGAASAARQERAFAVLHVEDDAELGAGLARLLRSAGFEVLSAADGAGALECVAHREAAPDLLIMDVNLSGEMDGADVAQEVCRTLGHVIPTIFLSGELSSVGLPWLPGAPLLFVAKPLDAEVLVEAADCFAGLGRFMRARMRY